MSFCFAKILIFFFFMFYIFGLCLYRIRLDLIHLTHAIQPQLYRVAHETSCAGDKDSLFDNLYLILVNGVDYFLALICLCLREFPCGNDIASTFYITYI